ncbi:MAG TPA: hypothetical protein VF604_15910 [Pyrinomonadaceae bacterium]|jgi:hypothetical protein
MPASTTEIIGFCDQLVQLLQDNQADLQTKGLDVTLWVTEIDALKSDAVTRDAEKDDLRAAAKTKTKESQIATKLAYKTASTRLDAVIGVLGKDTPSAKQAGRLRSSIIKQSKKKTSEEPTS